MKHVLAHNITISMYTSGDVQVQVRFRSVWAVARQNLQIVKTQISPGIIAVW